MKALSQKPDKGYLNAASRGEEAWREGEKTESRCERIILHAVFKAT